MSVDPNAAKAIFMTALDKPDAAERASYLALACGGDEVLRRLRAHDETHDTPVVVLSADATERQIERLMAAGATRYLTKPIGVRQLLDAIDGLFAPA